MSEVDMLTSRSSLVKADVFRMSSLTGSKSFKSKFILGVKIPNGPESNLNNRCI